MKEELCCVSVVSSCSSISAMRKGRSLGCRDWTFTELSIQRLETLVGFYLFVALFLRSFLNSYLLLKTNILGINILFLADTAHAACFSASPSTLS